SDSTMLGAGLNSDFGASASDPYTIVLPLYAVYVGAVGLVGVLALVAAALWRSRPIDPDVADCEQQARLFDPSKLDANILFDTTSQHIQPTLKSRVANTIHWKNASQQIIDTLRPEVVAEERGRLNFSLSFDAENSVLHVNIMEAIDLPAKDFTGSSDPYVRAFFLQCPQQSERTKVHRRNLAPKFNQTLSFPGYAVKRLHDMTLVLQVMDYDRFSSDDPIGEILLPLRNVKFENAPVYWKNLQRPTVSKENVGDVMLSLCYLPDANRITVSVIKARGLAAKDKLGSSDPYVKLWLVQNGEKLEKRKTAIKPCTLSPVFNESFAFEIPDKEKIATDVNLVVTVMDYDMLSSNDEIGHVVLGALGSDSGSRQWRQAIEHPEHPIASWHRLAPKW
ncbi:hypothetical protein PENTCL1PPCAC_7837, partial [Pristionchus entomophagus]